MTYTNTAGATRSTVTTQERAAKLSSMHIYAFTMNLLLTLQIKKEMS